MKRALRIVVILLILLIVLIGALQVLLKNQLGGLVNAHVVPVMEERLGVDVNLGDVSVDLLGGRVKIRDVVIGNPGGFSEGHLFKMDTFNIELGIKQLLFGGSADIHHVRLLGTEFNIIHDANGKLNLDVLLQNLSGEGDRPSQGDPAPESRDEPPSKKKRDEALPAVLVRSFTTELLLTYINHALLQDPIRLSLTLATDIQNMGTIPVDSEDQWGSIAISGTLESDAAKCVTDIRGRVAPIADPVKPSFDLNGSMASIDLSPFQDAMAAQEFSCDALSVELELVCRNGVFDEKVSHVNLLIHGLELKGDLARKTRYMDRLEKVTIPISIGGTLTDPQAGDFFSALQMGILANFQDNIAPAARNALRKRAGEAIGDSIKDLNLEESAGRDVKRLVNGLLPGVTDSTADGEEKDDTAADDESKDASDSAVEALKKKLKISF